MKSLSEVNDPNDLKKVKKEDLPELAREIRREIINTVSKNGGHLAPSLGAVDLTVALHYVFNCPRDKFIWDVGHQAYAHKILTGRKELFKSLRTHNGLSGFPKRTESEYDSFGTGHSSTSISAALGLAAARDIKGESYKVGMVDLLVKEIYNPSRNDPSFPFLRNFDVYEGHSYANGRGGGDFYFGNDEESTSEAMNSWAAVYLWGIATGNGSLVDLAVYGYTTQYEATKNYYYNIDGDIWSRSYFNHASVGMLFDSAYRWSLWWDPKITQTVMGT